MISFTAIAFGVVAAIGVVTFLTSSDYRGYDLTRGHGKKDLRAWHGSHRA